MIGQQLSVASIDNQAGDLATRWQQVVNDMLQFTNAVGALNVAALQALGFSSTDATNLATVVVNMAIFTTVYYGTAPQTVAFAYDTNFLQLRGTT